MLSIDTPLGGYIDHLNTVREDIVTAEGFLETAGDAVGKIKDLQQTIEEIKDDSIKLRETAKSLDAIVSLMSQFGPLKAIARPIASLSEEIKDRAKQLDEQVGTITEVVVPFTTVVKVMDGAIKAARVALWDARNDIGSVEESLNEASETLANTEGLLPEEVQATYDAVLGENGTVDQIAEDIDGVAAKITEIITGAQDVIDGIDLMDGFADAMARVASQISAVLDPVSSLINPMNAVGDVLEDFEWVLDAAEWVFDTVVSPVLDPILETLGIEALINRLAQPLEDLMPQIDILPDFLSASFDLSGKLEDVFGPVDGDTPGVFTSAEDAAGALSSLIQVGTTGIVGELFRDGAGTDDFIMGINTFLRNESTLNGGAGRDILGAGDGDDVLNGGDDSDILLAGGGNDILNGGNGIDAVVFNGYFGQFSFNAESSEETGSGPVPVSKLSFQDRGDTAFGSEVTYDVEYFVFRDISWTYEQLRRAIQVDYSTTPPTTEIEGDQPDPEDPTQTLINDILIGGDRDDTLLGLTGNDYMLGYEGFDTVRGGTGIDTYSYSGEYLFPGQASQPSLTGATILLDLTLDPALLAQRDDDIQGVENIVGSNSEDLIVGDERANELNGGGLGDRLFGGLGNDRLIGADGADALIGGRGNDVLSGGRALDVYFAGRGNDTYIADPTDAAGYQDFDLLYYGATYSVLLNTEVFSQYLANFGPYDVNFAVDLPDSIDANLTTGRVRKLDDTGAARFGVDTLINISNLLATDGDDLIRAGSFFAILDGADGDDQITGFRPTEQSDLQLQDIDGEAVAVRQGSVLVGGAGNDLLTSYNGDDKLVGGFGDDRIAIVTDMNAAAPADRLDQIGGIFGGFDTRTISLLRLIEDFDAAGDIADTGWDILDLTQSAHAWVLRLDVNTAEAYEDALPRSGVAGDLVNDMLLHGIEEIHLGDVAGEVWGASGQALHVRGGAGDDHLNGASGSLIGITLEGNGGNDRIMGGSGLDLLSGGDGDDLITDLAGLHDGVETMLGGDGDDVLRTAANSAYHLDGGTGHDLADFSGHDGALVLDMGRGRGTVFGRDFSESGVESVIGSAADDRITGTTGADLIAGHDGDDRLVGLSGDDALFGGLGDDNLQGGAGDDRLHGGLGNDRIFGGRGYDTIDVNATAFGEVPVHYEAFVPDFDLSWSINLATGNASVLGPGDAVGSANFTLVGIEAARGGDNDDMLTGNRFGNLLSAEAGDDIIEGAAGNDVLSGGDGDDLIRGGSGADQISGNRGENQVYGGSGNDIIIGAAEDDPVEMVYFNAPEEDLRSGRIELGSYADFPVDAFTIDMMVKADPVDLNGQGSYTLMSYAVSGSHNEFLIITEGATDQLRLIVNNTFVFDTGIATGSTLFDGEPHRVAVSMDSTTGSLALYIDNVLYWDVTDQEGLTPLTAGGHLVFGQDQDGVNANYDPNQAFIGAMGDIRLYDTALPPETMEDSPWSALENPASVDGLMAYWQIDPINGSQTIEDALGGPSLMQTNGSRMGHSSGRGDEIHGEAGADEIHGGAGGDVILGGNHDDLIYGDDGRDSLSGDAGNDTIFGGNGRDRMDGGTGNDMLHGGDEADQIEGGDGNDVIEGGGGNDFIFGGSGRDTYIYSSVEDTGNGLGNLDYIQDFVAGEDIIDLSAIDANTNTIADNAFIYVGDAGFSGRAGELAIFENSGLAVLSGDQTGDGTADFEIYLGSIDNWTSADFIL